MHTVFFRLLTFIIVAAIALSGCTQKAEVPQASASVSQSISGSLVSEAESKEATADSQALEAMTNPDVGEINADATASESESSASHEAPTYSQEPADADRSLPNEMTVRIIDKDGLPVRNICVYVNHHEGKPMHASLTFAVSDNEGIAILQRLRTTYSKTEQVTLSLCDRNQSRQPQQSVTMTIPEDNVTPVDIVWDVPETNLAVKNTMTFHLDDNTGNPVKNAWFSLCEASETKDGDDKVVVNYGVGSPEYTTELHDWDRCTDENGDVSWVNLPEGYYSVYLFLYKPPFSNVKSKHPRLKQKLGTPISNPVQRFYVTGEKEQKLTLTLP